MTENQAKITGTMAPNTTTTQGPSLHSLPENAAIIVAYSLVVVLAVPANGLVIFVIARVRAMHTSTNIVLLNLCVADLLVALLYLPFTTVDLYVEGYWVFGEVLCPLVSFLHSVAVSALILFLITIAVERYRRVCLRGRSQLTVKQTWVVVAVLWLLASFASCPQLIVKRVTQVKAWPVCVEAWPHTHGKVYTLIMFTLFYLIPLGFLILVYLRIARTFWRSATRIRSMRISRRPATSSKSRLTRISLVLVLSFAFSWAPSHALMLWYYLRDSDDYPDDVVAVIYPIVSWTASLNCALNPLLYCFMSYKFRASLSELWKRSSRYRSSELDGVESRVSKRQRNELQKKRAHLKEDEKLEKVVCVYESNV